MPKIKRIVLIVLPALLLAAGFTFAANRIGMDRQDRVSKRNAERMIKVLEPIHETIRDPQPGDWLARHDEPGQTFAQYIRSRPVRPDEKRTTLYVTSIGEFSEKQKEIFNLTVEFMRSYFGTPVRVLEEVNIEEFPESARRVHPSWGDKQILSTHVLEHVLYPQLPEDGWALLGLTSSDLWPGDGWNFVFGQASLRNRVGVWSIYRNGNPAESEAAFKLCLERTLRTATHETGHMLSINHCIYYECNMCGSNSQRESDSRPLYLCPICTAKITWATRRNPLERAKELQAFCEKHGLDEAATYYKKSIELLK